MTFGPAPRRRTLLTSLLGVAALTACTSGSEDADDPAAGDRGSDTADPAAASDGGESAPPDPAEAFTTVAVPWGRAEVTVGIRPLVRRDDHLVLTLDLSADDPHGDVAEDLITNFGYVWGSDGRWRGIRLLDLSADLVATPAVDTDLHTVWNGTDTARYDGETLLEGSLQLVYGDLGVDEVSLYLPKAPLVTGLPVLDGEPPVLDPDEDGLDLTAVDSAPLAPMQALTVDLLEPIHRREDAESVTVSIGSNLLFDSSSADLAPKAQDVLEDAAARIGTHEPGPVTIIGHTDDVDDESFNLDLSRRRAEAVASALGSLIDTAAYPLTTEGHGESEPIADNSTSEGRARNRRVELHISTPRQKEASISVATEVPPFEGPVGTGEEGVHLEPGTRPYLLRAVGARIVSEHLVVTLEVVIEDDEVDSIWGLGGFDQLPGYWGIIRWGQTDGGIAVLTGSTMTGPAFHDPGGDEEKLVPLTDLYPPSRIDGGVPRILELVYPRTIEGIAPGSTVTLQYKRDGFRLTDIPITG